METESEQQAEEAAREILSRGVHSVLVKRGTNGSLLIDNDGDVNLQPIFQVEKVYSEPEKATTLNIKSSLQTRGRCEVLLLVFDTAFALCATVARTVVQVVDTTGAGDCFTGAYAVAILEGKKSEDALNFAGGLSVNLKHANMSVYPQESALLVPCWA